jgi:hypothetical protein
MTGLRTTHVFVQHTCLSSADALPLLARSTRPGLLPCPTCLWGMRCWQYGSMVLQRTINATLARICTHRLLCACCALLRCSNISTVTCPEQQRRWQHSYTPPKLVPPWLLNCLHHDPEGHPILRLVPPIMYGGACVHLTATSREMSLPCSFNPQAAY